MSLSVPVIVLITLLCLAGAGFYCLLITRNLIKVVVGLQLLVKAAVVAFILAGHITGRC